MSYIDADGALQSTRSNYEDAVEEGDEQLETARSTASETRGQVPSRRPGGDTRSTYTSPPQPRQQQPRSREQQRDAGAAFQTPREFSEDEVREAFNAFDTDGDGFLTCDDVMLFFEALGETLTRREVQEMMAMVDTRGMGYIDFVQFFELATRSAGYFAK